MKRLMTFRQMNESYRFPAAFKDNDNISDELLHDLEDLSLDIRDKGFDTEVSRVDFYDPEWDTDPFSGTDPRRKAIALDIWYEDGRDPFYLSEIRQEFDRIAEWAESNGLETHIAAEFGDGNPDYSRLEGFLEDHDGSDFVSLSMIFPLAASRPI